MPTSLFPEDSETITIAQGKAGDCYLLAYMDCLLNGSLEYRAHVKELFNVLDDGSIELKLHHGPLTKNLKHGKLQEKGYTYRHEGKFDIFTISPEAVNRIDSDQNGAKTNSLAIKLLEHISTYYYTGNWHATNLDSVFAHDINDRHGDSNSSTEFMGTLLGIQAIDKPGSSIDEIIRMKLANPEQAVYISMSYGLKDFNGNFHGRHALRIKEITPDLSIEGGYKFILVNPWENQSTEEYTYLDIAKRKPRFSLMSLLPADIKPVQNDLPPNNLAEVAVVYDEKLPELKAFVISYLKETAFHGSKDISNKMKLDNYLSHISNVSSFSEMNEIAVQAYLNVSKENTPAQALKLLQDIKNADSSHAALENIKNQNKGVLVEAKAAKSFTIFKEHFENQVNVRQELTDPDVQDKNSLKK